MKLLTLALLAGFGTVAHAQVSYPHSFAWSQQSAVGMQAIPTTTAALSNSGVVYLSGIHLSDPTGAAVTVTLYDGTTAIYSINLGGSNPSTFDNGQFKLAPLSIANGLSWKASVANTALGNISWQY